MLIDIEARGKNDLRAKFQVNKVIDKKFIKLLELQEHQVGNS